MVITLEETVLLLVKRRVFACHLRCMNTTQQTAASIKLTLRAAGLGQGQDCAVAACQSVCQCEPGAANKLLKRQADS